MTEENMENDTPTNEGEQDTTPEEESEETNEELSKTKEAYENQKVRAEKAEKDLKELRAQSEKETPKNDTDIKNDKLDEPDYARLSFLEQRGIKHPDDQKLVQDEASRLKLPLTDILGMDHIKSKLKDANDTREASDGTPKGKGSKGGKGQQDVDYWVKKGETPDDLELAGKVIDARMKKDSSQKMFADELYTG